MAPCLFEASFRGPFDETEQQATELGGNYGSGQANDEGPDHE